MTEHKRHLPVLQARQKTPKRERQQANRQLWKVGGKPAGRECNAAGWATGFHPEFRNQETQIQGAGSGAAEYGVKVVFHNGGAA
jgi:hypothetical protein